MSPQLTVRPVSDQWIDLTTKLSDVSWEIMELIRGPYAAYGGDFLLTENGRQHRVTRDVFDINRVNFICGLYELITRQFGLNSSSDLEQALKSMQDLNDGYGMKQSDLAYYQNFRNELADQRLPLNPTDEKAKGRFNYIHALTRFALYKHGDLVCRVITPTILRGVNELTSIERVNDLYCDQSNGGSVGDNQKLRLFTDLVTLATAAFKGKNLPILQRIAYHDKRFKAELQDMSNPHRMEQVPPLSKYIARAANLPAEELPLPYHLQEVI